MNDGGSAALFQSQANTTRTGITLKQGPPIIPDKYFEDILVIWDTCRTFAGIVHDILSKKEESINSERKND
jgi:hypothetical protein